jgi:UDP-glucose 4-epimerase
MIARCLVLGGTGFLGSHLCNALLSRGHYVRVLTRRAPKDAWANINKVNVPQSLSVLSNTNLNKNRILNNLSNSFECITGDFSDKSIILEATKKVDYVFHLVSTTIPATSNKNPIFDIESNVISSLHLLESCRENNVAKIIFYSSGGTVYGIPENCPIDECHSIKPISSYGIQKSTIEQYIRMFNYLYGLKAIILRISNPYGIGQSLFKGQGLVGTCIHKILNNQEIEIWGDGSVIRDYIHVDDVILASIYAIEIEKKFGVYNIGSGEGKSVNDVIQTIEEELSIKARLKYQENRLLDVPVNVLNNQLAKKELNWEPKINFKKGIGKVAAETQKLRLWNLNT